jgi:predicted CopG family antitoxin
MDSMVSTISLSEETKRKIRRLGQAGESYEDVIKRMYEVTKSQILLHYLYDTSDSVSIDEAIAEARKRWPKSS